MGCEARELYGYEMERGACDSTIDEYFLIERTKKTDNWIPLETIRVPGRIIAFEFKHGILNCT